MTDATQTSNPGAAELRNPIAIEMRELAEKQRAHRRITDIASTDLLLQGADEIDRLQAMALRLAEAQPPFETSEPQPMAWIGVPEGYARSYDLIYDGSRKLEGYRYAPVWRPEDHPCAQRDAAEAASAQPICEMSRAAADVIAERLRQLTKEGWTPAHDDQHDTGEMAEAAACCALKAAGNEEPLFERWWPWASSWWKPKDKRRDLVRAGALILAEIERLDRHPVETSARCVHVFDFIPFKGIVCTKCGAVATTETTPPGHTEHHWVPQGAGMICDGCGLIRPPGKK